jgi:outer membrane protein TolC
MLPVPALKLSFKMDIDVANKLGGLVMALLLALNWVHPSPVCAEADSLDELIALALQQNPALMAAEADWERASHGVLPAKSLDDPVLSISFLNYPVDSLRYDQTPMTGNEIRLSQKLPFPGKLALRGKIQEQKALWQEGLYEEKKLQLVRQVKDAYYRYQFQAGALTILNRDRALLEEMLKTLEAQYATGRTSQQQVFVAQQKVADLMNRILVEEQKQAAVYAEIETLTAAPVSLAPVADALPKPVEVPAGKDDAYAQAERQRPMMKAYQALIDQYRHEKQLAVLDEKPDFNLWAGYNFRDGSDNDPVDGVDYISAGISFNLPFQRAKRIEEQAAAAAGIRQAAAALASYRDQVHFNISEAGRRMDLARQQQLLYETTLLPQARQTFQASINSFQVGNTDYQSTLEMLLQLSNRELVFQQFITDFYRNLAWYEYETGQNRPAGLKGDS